MKKPILYTLIKQSDPSSRHYTRLSLSILEHRQFTDPKDNNCEVSAEITWQTDDDREAGDWYGRTVRITLGSHEGPQAARLTRIARVIARLLPEGGSHTPQALLDILNRAGAVRMAYDGRLSSYVSEADRPDPALLRYMDDYRTMGTQGCTVSVLALDTADAKAALTEEFAKLSRRATIRESEEARWIAAGKPVICSRPHECRPAEFPSVESLLGVPQASAPYPGAVEYSMAA